MGVPLEPQRSCSHCGVLSLAVDCVSAVSSLARNVCSSGGSAFAASVAPAGERQPTSCSPLTDAAPPSGVRSTVIPTSPNHAQLSQTDLVFPPINSPSPCS